LGEVLTSATHFSEAGDYANGGQFTSNDNIV
jgi:hypothetical protein